VGCVSGRHPRAGAWAVASGGAVAVAVMLATTSVPLYDGLGLPEEPYRHLGAESEPQSAVRHVSLTALTSPPLYVATGENGPQAALALPEGALALPGPQGKLTVRLTPVRPALEPPGKRLGNVYRVSVTVDGEPVVPRPDVTRLLVQLRVPEATKNRVDVVLRQAGSWGRLTTARIGEHVYSARLPVFGDVAAVEVSPLARAAPYGVDERTPLGPALMLVLGGVLVLLVWVVVLRRRQAAEQAESPGQGLSSG
jgi:hypothetical protein